MYIVGKTFTKVFPTLISKPFKKVYEGACFFALCLAFLSYATGVILSERSESKFCGVKNERSKTKER